MKANFTLDPGTEAIVIDRPKAPNAPETHLDHPHHRRVVVCKEGVHEVVIEPHFGRPENPGSPERAKYVRTDRHDNEGLPVFELAKS